MQFRYRSKRKDHDMSELTVYQEVKDPLAFAMQFGAELAKSKMFGCENESQGRVLALACLCDKQSPTTVAKRNNIIGGKLSLKYDAMLSDFIDLGGDHKVISRTAELAEIELTLGDRTFRESLSWEDAKAEPFVYAKDGKTLKKNWATPRARRQMLWARVVSEAVRVLAPQINAGLYTPEEAIDLVDEPTTVVESEPVDTEQLMREAAEAVDDKPVDAEFDVKPHMSSPEQVAEISSQLERLKASKETIEKIKAKRKVAAWTELTHQQAAELITALAMKQPKEPAIADISRVKKGEPVDEHTVEAIKAKLQGESELIDQIKAHLHKHDKKKLADLSQHDAMLLQNCLEINSIESFLDQSLERFGEENGDGDPS